MLINDSVKYESPHLFRINEEGDTFFYFFDYDERYYAINMEFQHYHRFFELCIFLDHSAVHIIEGNFYELECGDIVMLKPLLLHKTQYPEGSPNRRIIINFAFPTNLIGLNDSYKHLFELFNNPLPIYRFKGREKKRNFLSLKRYIRMF